MRRRLFKPARFVSTDNQGRATVTHRHIYILPTGFGLMFGLLLLTMLLGSMNYASNLGYMTTFLLAGLGLVAMLHTYRNQLGLQLEPGRSRAVFAGQKICFEVRVNNLRSSPRPCIQIRDPEAEAHPIDLSPNQSQVVQLCRRAHRRGRLRLGRVIVSTHYPLGLFRAWSYVELGLECLIYPRPVEYMCNAFSTRDLAPAIGTTGAGTDDFVGLRSYRLGDSPRHIDWKALAKERGLLIRDFQGDRGEPLWIDWGTLNEADAETRLAMLCRCVLTLSKHSLTFGLRLPGTVIPSGQGGEHLKLCLEALARFDA